MGTEAHKMTVNTSRGTLFQCRSFGVPMPELNLYDKYNQHSMQVLDFFFGKARRTSLRFNKD